MPSLGHQSDVQAGGADGGVVGDPVDQAVVVSVGQRLLLEVGKHPDEDAAADVIAVGSVQAIGPAILAGHPVGVEAIGAFIIRQRQPELLQIVDALGPASGFAGRLDGRQEQGDQDRDDRDDDEQLDQGEAAGDASPSRLRATRGGEGRTRTAVGSLRASGRVGRVPMQLSERSGDHPDHLPGSARVRAFSRNQLMPGVMRFLPLSDHHGVRVACRVRGRLATSPCPA